MMGLGDFDSRGLVGKISQIALQGRKYGIGLLVISQRTATVVKLPIYIPMISRQNQAF